MNAPALSIIIPTLNSQNTIEACLNSIINQTFQNFEIVLIDGQSNDNTNDIIKAYSLIFPNIRWVSEHDTGIYHAMNKGITLARGAFLLFLGSDDELYCDNVLKDVFSDCSELADLIYGDVYLKDRQTVYSGESNMNKLLYQQVSICHQAIFYSRRTFELVGNYNQKYFIHADYDLNVRCFENSTLTKKYLAKVITLYNETGISNTHSNADHFHDDLTLKYINQSSGLFSFFNDYKNLKHELENIKRSKLFRLEEFKRTLAKKMRSYLRT